MKRRLHILAAALLVGWLGWCAYRAAAGEPSDRLDESWHRGTRVLDRQGRLLRELPSDGGARGRPLPLDEMGDRLVLATLAAEDKRFYEHSGVDSRAVLRALSQNVRHVRIVSGGSTITQQLVKLLDHEGVAPRDRDLGDKVRESARAQNLERTMDKRAILEAYLNRLSYGRGLTGPDAAARAMFGVAPRDLSWAQAALLAVLPRAPSYLDPYEHRERAVDRQRLVLDELARAGWIERADHERARLEPIELQPLAHAFQAPHFVEALRSGALPATPRDGAVRTTLDGDLQRDVEGLVASHRARLAGRADGAAVLVIDNASGEVLAYLGSPDWFDETIDGKVDMVRARRQPGSALKPFVYAMAFERGLQPSEMLADVATRFADASGAYAPENFDRTFFGPVSAREALAGSLNVPAVRLAADLPHGALLERLRALGIESLDRSADHYGAALALGSGEVTMWELTRAYVTLARGGDAIPLRYTAEENDLGRAVARGAPLIDRQAAAAVADSLSDPLARVRGLGGTGPFDLGFPVAVKTGTSSGFRDSWTLGYTRERTVAVWVGNASGRATRELTGGSGAGPLFADIMRRAMRAAGTPQPLWDRELLVERAVCPLSGQRIGPACPESVTRRLMPRHLHAHDREHCTLHRHAVGDPPRCADEGRRIVTLPEAFDTWLASQPAGAPGRDPLGLAWYPAASLAGCHDAVHGVPALRIDEPAPGAVLLAAHDDDRIELAASLPASPLPMVEFLVDGRPVARSAPPYRATVSLRRGDHIVEVRPVDPTLRIRPAESRFSIR